MPTAQELYDDAMFDFSTGDYPSAIEKLKRLVTEDPENFDAQLSLGMAYYRQGDYTQAIAEGHKAEKMRPKEQLVHTNLSLFYMKAGDKKTAEHHGLQARIAGWRENMARHDKSAGRSQNEVAQTRGINHHAITGSLNLFCPELSKDNPSCAKTCWMD
jgi:Flp pilus assembly protein TadD